MTLKEYVKQYYPRQYESIYDYEEYDRLNTIIFPPYIGCVQYEPDLDYKPFQYRIDETHTDNAGGRITADIAYYIGLNYSDHEMFSGFTFNNETVKPLMNKVLRLMYRYKYKWNALWNSMELDSDYNPLDNVEEHYVETTTRTPELEYNESGNMTTGKTSSNTTNSVGAHDDTITNEYGDRSGSTTSSTGLSIVNGKDSNGSRGDSTITSHGIVNSETDTNNKVYPYDDSEVGADSTSTHTHSKTDSVNDAVNTITGEQVNKSFQRTDSRNDVINTSNAGYTDTTTTSVGAHSDNLTTTDNGRMDSSNKSRYESGKETTVIERDRHGNIGVTMATDLINAYRQLHYFDLVQIMANDIINEIFDMNFDC